MPANVRQGAAPLGRGPDQVNIDGAVQYFPSRPAGANEGWGDGLRIRTLTPQPLPQAGGGICQPQ
jgi:hypothetical protein